MKRALITLMAATTVGTIAQAQPRGFPNAFAPYAMPTLSATENATLARLRQEHGASSIRVLRFNAPVMLSARARDPRTLSLGGGMNLDSQTRQTIPLGGGRTLWRGDIPPTAEGLPSGEATLVIQGSSATGTVSAPDGRRFQVRPLGGDATAVIEVDFARDAEEPPGNPGLNAPAGASLDVVPQIAHLADASPSIDLLVVYTASAAGASGGIDALIDLATIETNDSFVKSGVDARVEVVGRREVAIVEGGKSYDEVMAAFVRSPDIATERNARRADVVILIINQPQYCGQANEIGATAAQAYALVHYGCATGYFSFGHEIGHLAGARHDLAADPEKTPYEYGHGYTYAGHTGAFRTIMGYACRTQPCNPRIQHWSNPVVTYGGRPTGEPKYAHDARVWAERAAALAAFR